MKKLLLFILVLGLGCQSVPNKPSESLQLDMQIQWVDAPSHHSLFAPASQHPKGLRKPDLIVDEEVVRLTFDTILDSLAQDQTEYDNDAKLFNFSTLAGLDGRAVSFTGVNSYGEIENAPELNPNVELEITAQIRGRDTRLNEQVIAEKRDPQGGYTFGISYGTLFFRLDQVNLFANLTSTTLISPNEWYKVGVIYNPNEISLFINDEPDTSVTNEVPVPIPNTTAPIAIGATNSYFGDRALYFRGEMDAFSIRSAIEYEEFDAILAVVIDLSNWQSADSFWVSEEAIAYGNEVDLLTSGEVYPSWQEWIAVWEKYFQIVMEQALTVRKGFAEGDLNGVEGLNVVALSAIRDNQIVYTGEGYIHAEPGQPNLTVVELYPLAR